MIFLADLISTGMWSAAKSWPAYISRASEKKILARMAVILAILLFFSARGLKMNNIQKKAY